MLAMWFCVSLVSQTSAQSQSDFPYYHITELEEGMQFMVEPQGLYNHHAFNVYHKKGRGERIDLNRQKGDVFTFKRYENRRGKCLEGGRCDMLYVIFEKDSIEYEYPTFKTVTQLKKTPEERMKVDVFNQGQADHVEGFVFYDDVIKAKETLLDRVFYLSRSAWGNEKINHPYRITGIEPNTATYPAQITYTDVETGGTHVLNVRLSGTNEKYNCKSNSEGCNFFEYFMSEEDFNKQQKEQD